MKNRDKNNKKTTLRVKWLNWRNRLTGKTIEYDLSKYGGILQQINMLDFRQYTNTALAQELTVLKRSVLRGECCDAILPQVYALVNEAAQRQLTITPYSNQLVAGIALHQGKVVEMPTGEGKTLAAVFPAVLNALSGQGVHVLTANDYLGQRDADWMGPIYNLLGFSVGFVRQGMSIIERQQAYQKDITYLTAKEAGFDYLRDNIRFSSSELVHRPFHFAIVDEADLILIDEARVPMVIAGEYEEQTIDFYSIASLVRTLTAEDHFRKDDNWRNVSLTEEGINVLESQLLCGNLFAEENMPLLSAINLALHAENLLHRDIDYIVREGRVKLVDEITGRVADKRRWPNGIHQAVEAKENVPQQREGRVMGSITLQHFLSLYQKMAGMTATATPAAEELKTFYKLNVVVVPPHLPSRRYDHQDQLFAEHSTKYRSIVEEICLVHGSQRPILVGTASVKESEHLAGMLMAKGIEAQVLNAKDDRKEAAIIANAGKPGAVTISTNMAGRGTDIRLGGADEQQRRQVVELGGLYVIGTNRHESLRIDFQLRGRAGRQGDPGATRYFTSLEDFLMRRYGLKKLLPEGWFPADPQLPLRGKMLQREVDRVQRIVEDQNFQIRQTLWEYARLEEEQRKLVQRQRQDILLETDPLHFLKQHCAADVQKLLKVVGRQRLVEVEKIISLSIIDHHWSEYLEWFSEVKDGIHLQRLGGLFPLEEFRKKVDREFWKLFDHMDEEIIRLFQDLQIRNGDIDLAATSLRGPSSTWTYLINDNPFG